MDHAFAEAFATEWIAAWNAHDLPRVLAHYAEDFEMTSPMIVAIAGEPSGRLRGRPAVGAYWRKALDLVPDLRFELVMVLAGVNSLTIDYVGVGGRRVAEVFHFGRDGEVAAAYAHYA
jgi:hypothetical protein